MKSDSPDIRANGTNMRPNVAKLSTTSHRPSARVDAKHRRWIDQVLAESLDQTVSLPWTRASAKDSDGTARKTPHDAN